MKRPFEIVIAAIFSFSTVTHALNFVSANLDPTATPLYGWTGVVGTRFGVEAADIPSGAQVKVTHLGFYAGTAGQFNGANAVDVVHNVTLSGPQNYNNRRGDFSTLPVASAVIPIGNPVDANGWSWVALANPVVLQGGQYYVVAVDNVTNSLDPYFDPNKGPGGTASILAPGSIFRNGLGGTDDGYMSGRYGLDNGWEAYYSSGYLGASFQYTLDTAPTITTDLPASTIVAEGGSTTLSVTLSPSGYPAVTYLWEHDPLPIEGNWVTVGTNPTHTISAAIATDAGDYRVTVTNSAGSDQSVGSVVVDPDTDGDGLSNIFETNTGIYVSPTNTGTKPNDDDSDDDGLTDGEEILTFTTDPNIPDTDGDGLTDGNEVDVHSTNPVLADTDTDGLLDGEEVNTHTTNPLAKDTDADGYWDGYEIANSSLPTDTESPGGPNPTAVAVCFNNQAGEVTGYGLSSAMYAGAPTVRQKNWNRTNPLGFPANGDLTAITSPTASTLVDSSGNPTTMTMSFSAVGAWSDDNEDQTPYGRLFSAFIYHDSVNKDVDINLGNIPYALYDVYVYVGAGANGSRTTVSNGASTYSFTTSSNATSGGTLGVDVYTESTSATGFPQANYAVFRNVSTQTFSFKASRDNINAGIFGFQVVQRTPTLYQAWAISKGLDLNVNGAPSSDADSDGTNNLLEYGLSTDPTNASSFPVFNPLATGGDLSLTYNRATAATDLSYTAQWSTNLVDWFPTGLTDVPSGNTTANTIEHVVTVTKASDKAKFLRIVVNQP